MRNCFPLIAGAIVLAQAVCAEPARMARSVVRADARSGRLVRSVVVQPKVVAPKIVAPKVIDNAPSATENLSRELPPDAAIPELIEQAARKYNVDPNLVHAVVKVESNYNPFAVSHAGAEGLMQLVPSTARRFGVANSFDPRQNIDAGVRYLKYLQTLYRNNTRLALAAYNAGEGAVFKYQGIPRYRETENYLYQVARRWGELNRGRRPAASKPARGAVQSDLKRVETGLRSVETVVDAEGKIHFRTK
jgi:soluble lytic murein transglycosylase-like protein